MTVAGVMPKGLVLVVGFLWFVQKGSARSNSFTTRRRYEEQKLSNPLRGLLARRGLGLPVCAELDCGCASVYSVLSLRGGGDDTVEVQSYPESGSESESQSDETDSESIDYIDGDESTTSMSELESTQTTAFVEPFRISPTIQLYATIGSIVLSRRLDLSNPSVVRLVRFAFITQVVVQQCFVLFVRITASNQNDRTLVKKDGLISKVMSTYMKGAVESSGVAKSLASTFLNMETTVMEYDLDNASRLQAGVLFNLALMWYLHFRLNKVQPLLMQTVTGCLQLVFNPLFQIYFMRRNIKRPFEIAPPLAMAGEPANASS